MANHKEFVDSFRKALNSHGYGFQYAVLKLAYELFDQGKSPWAFEVTEFPVTVAGRDTRIDFILHHRNRPLYLIAECKRANPALSNWCFAKAPYVVRNQSQPWEPFVAERISFRGPEPRSEPDNFFPIDDAYHVAWEVSEPNKRGDPDTGGRGKIESTVTQVLTGSNGFAEYVRTHASSYNSRPSVVLLPVIFTTAVLWTTNGDLRTASLKTGEIDLTESEVTQADVVFYQYPMSATIRHSLPRDTNPKQLREVLLADHLRSVRIVSPTGIERFLQRNQLIAEIEI